MRNMNSIVNEYYEVFVSTRGLFAKSPIFFAMFAIASMFALFTTFAMVGLLEVEWYVSSKSSRFAFFVVSFLLAVAISIKLSLEKEELNVERAKKFLSSREDKIYQLKTKWFETCVAPKSTDYLKLAESLDKASLLREKYRGFSDLSVKDFVNVVFAEDSKPRVLAMFLMLSAMVATLSVKEDVTLTSVLEFYGQASPEQLVWIFFYFPTVIFIGYLEVKYFLIAIARATERFFERFNGENVYSKRRTRIFINELIRQCSLEKTRIKHDGELYKLSNRETEAA